MFRKKKPRFAANDTDMSNRSELALAYDAIGYRIAAAVLVSSWNVSELKRDRWVRNGSRESRHRESFLWPPHLAMKNGCNPFCGPERCPSYTHCGPQGLNLGRTGLILDSTLILVFTFLNPERPFSL